MSRIALFVLLILSLSALAAPPTPAPTAPGTDVEGLRVLSLRLEAEYQARRGVAYQELLARDAATSSGTSADDERELMGIRDDGFPIYYITHNLNAARTVSTDDVWSAPYSLDGSTLGTGRLGVWDGGAVRGTHQEFGGRVTQMDGAGAEHFHATHVAGTMIGAGVSSNAKGMAPAALLRAWNWTSDDSEMTTAAAGGMHISNHSYGVATGWQWNSGDSNWYWYGNIGVSAVEDYEFGFYDNSARNWDIIARNAPGYLVFKSAGNDRSDSGPGAGGGHYVWIGGTWAWSTATRDADGGATGYDTLSPKSTAKNIMVVGAVNDIPGGYTNPGGVSPASFSSYGPTDDGRIKPDLVANGVGLTSAYVGTDASYASLSGTSMSSPSAAGSAALVSEYYQAQLGSLPLASTLKALLIHTADEAGSYVGPDYRFGWGLMNTRTAIETVDLAVFVEGSLANGAVDEYVYDPLPGQPLAVTLVWADVAGNPAAAALDPTDSMLINDLDVRIIQDGLTSEPWILNPASPSSAATHGDNTRDNVEQVEIAAATGGQVTVRVTHKGNLSQAQAYSLVVTGITEGAGDWTDVTTVDLAGTGTSNGVSWIDIDDDGDHDLYVTNFESANVLLRNDGGAFTDITTAPLNDAGRGYASIFADYDNDGDADLYMTRDLESNRLLRNDGGVFTDVSQSPHNDSGPARGAAWTDENVDGKLDLHVANYAVANALYRAYGDVGGGIWFFFSQSGTIANAGNGAGVGWCDYDNDGDPDPYLTNRGGANQLLLNGLTLGYYDQTAGMLGDMGNGGSVCWGDYDNDGKFDLYFTNDGTADVLLRNTGAGFSLINGGALGDAGNGRGAAWGDYDNDGDLDLYVARINSTDMLLRNDGGGVFAFVTQGFPHTPGNSTSCAWCDFDGDGDLDIYIAADGGNRLIRNDIVNDNHWFHLDLTGTDSNSDAIGAKVRLVSGGLSQVREIRAGEGTMAQPSHTVEFGLGAAAVVDTVEIFWPSGTIQTLVGLAADQRLSVTEGVTVGVADDLPSRTLSVSASPNPFNPITEIRFVSPTAGAVNLAIHDVAGRRVRTLLSTDLPAGEHSAKWDGRDDGGRPLPSGTYYAVVRAPAGLTSTSLTLIK